MTDAALVLENVSKRLGSKFVLTDISFEVTTGITGVVGPNGAGKSTLLDICADFTKPSRGQVLRPPAQNGTGGVGYLPQTVSLPSGSTVEQIVAYALWIRGWRKNDRRAQTELVINRAGLVAEANTRVGKLSGGTAHRVAFAAATAHDPALVILDEPTTGLDVEQRALVRDLILEQASHRSVLISSHIAEDIETLCGYIVAISQGKLRFSGSTEKFLIAFDSSSVERALIAASRAA